MASVHYEMHSFLTKLSQLNNCGFNANLHFNCYEGRIYVNLNADLGFFPQNDWSETWNTAERKMAKPSRIKRRLRRKQTMDSKCNNSDTMVAAADSPQADKKESAPVNVSPSANDDSLDVPQQFSIDESLADTEEPEPGWVWTPPTDDDIRHYLEQMKALEENVNGSKEQLVNNIASAKCELSCCKVDDKEVG